MNSSPGALLRAKLNERRGLLVPGCGNALAARVIEALRFEAVYLSGAGLTNNFYGVADLGFIHLGDVVQHTAAIREAVQLPLTMDADTGFGKALNVRQTVRALERAGANAIQLEDQVMPKKCGHFAGKGVIDANEMDGKIRAAADARSSEVFLLIARTDARAAHGLEGRRPTASRARASPGSPWQAWPAWCPPPSLAAWPTRARADTPPHSR